MLRMNLRYPAIRADMYLPKIKEQIRYIRQRGKTNMFDVPMMQYPANQYGLQIGTYYEQNAYNAPIAYININ